MSMRFCVHLVQKVNGKKLMSNEGVKIMRDEFDKRIDLLRKQFEMWLLDQANLESLGGQGREEND